MHLILRAAAVALVLGLAACSSGGSHTAGPPAATVAPSAPPVPPAPAVFPADWPFRAGTPSPHGARGMVVTDCAIGTKVGADVLAGGGNAVDAAVATAFALAVAFPTAG